MPRVIIQPSFGNTHARRHWRDTLDKEVPFVSPPYSAALKPEQRAALEVLHPSGSARFWGATQRHDSKMRELEQGDIVLFTGLMTVRAIGEVGATFANADFANTMWRPDEENGTYTNVYSLITFEPQEDLPYSVLGELGIKTGDNFRQTRFLKSDQSEAVLRGLRIRTLTQARKESQLENALAERLAARGVVVAKEASNVTTTSYTRLPGTTVVNRAESLLVDAFRKSLGNDQGKRLRLAHGVTDYYREQDDEAVIIEAKSNSGHDYVREALGQLHDYVLGSPLPVLRLGALFPARPAAHSIEYLHHYGIDCIFMEANNSFTHLAAPDASRDRMRSIWNAEKP